MGALNFIGLFALLAIGLYYVYQTSKDSHWAEQRWHKCSSLGIPYLLAKRTWLRANAVRQAPTIENKDFPLPPKPTKYEHRVSTGHYTAPDNDLAGAVGQPLTRHANFSGTKSLQYPTKDPNPLLVAEKLLHRTGKVDWDGPELSTDIANLWAAAWIQFMVHDWVPAHFVDLKKTTKYEWNGKSLQLPTTLKSVVQDGEPFYGNKGSHWWMGSQIYGNTIEIEHSLRSMKDGKMTVTENYLPRDPQSNLEKVGAGSPNFWFGLTMLHYIFVLEHNSICDMLKKNNPKWDDERLFQTARLINGAQIARIHTIDWTTAIVQHPVGRLAQYSLWQGLLGILMPAAGEARGYLSFLNSNTLWGIAGGTLETLGVNFAHTEEFVGVYRFHSLIPDVFHLLSHKDGHEKIKDVEAKDFIMDKSYKINVEHQKDTLYSLGVHRVGQLELHNYPQFLQNLKVPSQKPTIDMAGVDLVRDRERQVPRFNDVRRSLGLLPISRWEELTKDAETLKLLKEVYGKDGWEKLDLMVGTLAEPKVPGYLFSPTIYALFTVQTQRRLESDPFYTTKFTPEVYTQPGIDWVQQSTFGKVLLRHWPEFKEYLPEGKNAFMPWHKETQPLEKNIYGNVFKTFFSFGCYFGDVEGY